MGVPWHPQEPRHLESDVSRWWWDGIGPVNSEAKKTSCITVKSVYWCSSDFAVAMSLHRLLIQSALFHLLWRSLYFYFKDLNHLISMLTCFHHAHAYPVPLGGTLTHETTAARPATWSRLARGLGCGFLCGWNACGLPCSSTPISTKMLFHTCLPLQVLQMLTEHLLCARCYGRHRGKIWATPLPGPSRSSEPGDRVRGAGGIRARVEGHGRGENASHWRLCVTRG